MEDFAVLKRATRIAFAIVIGLLIAAVSTLTIGHMQMCFAPSDAGPSVAGIIVCLGKVLL